jgi:hypothetical protein
MYEGVHRRVRLGDKEKTMQKLTNTYISDNQARKCLVYVDGNSHYNVSRYKLYPTGWKFIVYGREKFKHFHTAERAVNKWIK